MASPSKFNHSKHDRKNSSDLAPSLNLWVGDLHPETKDHDMISVFKDFGALDAIVSYYPRIFALVMFNNIEDSKKAMEALQGSLIKGRKIKIQFGRPTISGKLIWIGGISKTVSEEQLMHELLQFGKIEELKFTRDRNSAVVWYSNLDDAIAAKKNMNGKSIGGQPVRVDFQKPLNPKPESSSQLHGGLDGPPCNTLWVRYPPSVHMDKDMLHNTMILFGEIEAIRTVPMKNYCFVVFRSVEEARRAKDGLDGRLFGDPRIHIKFATSSLTHSGNNAPILPGYRKPKRAISLNEPLLCSNESFGHIHSQLFGPGFSLYVPHSRHESEPGSVLGAHPRTWAVSNIWDDGNDATVSKRPRFDESPPNNVLFYERDQSPIIRGSGRTTSKDIWHGVLAKGGSPVCHARCVAVGNGLESPLPEIIDCFAKTDLDKLRRQYNEARDFDSVFFYPASEKDFDPYTEFLRYLSDNNRVGVAKCADETHLFLVPPSDFLTKILKITGPERLYGVVFKSLHQPIQEARQPRLIEQREDSNLVEVRQPRYFEQRDDSNLQEVRRTQYIEQREHTCLGLQQQRYIEHREDHNFRNSNELVHMNENAEAASENFSSMHSNSVASATRPSNSEVPLSSDILSILTSLLPVKARAGAVLSNDVPLASSVSSSSFNANATQDHQPWYGASRIDPPTFNSTSIQPQHFGSQSNISTSSFVSQYPTHDNSTQSQNLASGFPRLSADPAGHLSNYSPRSEQTFPSDQHHQLQETYYDPYGTTSYDDSPSNTLQNEIGSTAEYSGQMQSGQVAVNMDCGAPNRQVAVDSVYHDDVEKNQKYQQTLNLAATLLQQLQQKQQNDIYKGSSMKD